MPLDPVGQQHAVVRIVFLEEHGKQASGAIAMLPSGGAPHRVVSGRGPQPAVRVIEEKLEAGAGTFGAAAAEFIFRVPEHEHQHVVDILGHIKVGFDTRIVSPQGLDAGPRTAIAIIGIAGFRPATHVQVAIDGFVVFRRSAKVVGLEVGIPPFAQMIDAPVGSIVIEMDPPAVRIQRAHIQQDGIGEGIGKIEAAVHHVMGATAEFQRIERFHGGEAAGMIGKERVVQPACSKALPEVYPEALLREIRVIAAETLHPAVFLKSAARGTSGLDQLQRSRDIQSVRDAQGSDHGEARQVIQGRDHLRSVGGIIGDGG